MMQELSYIRCGDYYIPDIRLPKETRPIGRWGRMHRDYIKEHNPIRFNDLCLNGELWTYLADLNEQAQNRLELIIEQMKSSEGVTEELKSADQMAWVGAMNIEWTDEDKIKKQINDIIESVRRDEKYNNAMQFSDKQNARDESDRAAHEAVMNSMQSGLELFREVQNNPSFRKWLFDSAFNSTYQANHNQTSL